MLKGFRKDSEAEDAHGGAEKPKSQQVLLLVLLLLVAVFCYLYFFTGLIKPSEESSKPQANQAAPVKKPIPPRADQGAKSGGEQAKAETKTSAPVTKPAPAASQAKTPPPPAKPVTAAKTETAKNVAPSPAPVAAKPTAQPAATKPAAARTVSPAAQQKPIAKAGASQETIKIADKGAKPAKTEQKVKVTVKQGGYALVLTDDFAPAELKSVVAKVKKAGATAISKKKVSKEETMHRLFMADFVSHDSAQGEMERLRKLAPDAFMMLENGKYSVYAGSYLREAKASAEKERLFNKGIHLDRRTAQVSVAVFRIRAGGFSDSKAAGKAAEALKKYGIGAKIVKAAP